eukprot:1357942-Amphidinium_carterae.1
MVEEKSADRGKLARAGGTSCLIVGHSEDCRQHVVTLGRKEDSSEVAIWLAEDTAQSLALSQRSQRLSHGTCGTIVNFHLNCPRAVTSGVI